MHYLSEAKSQNIQRLTKGKNDKKKLKKLLYEFYVVSKNHLDEAKKEFDTDMAEYVIAKEKTQELYRALMREMNLPNTHFICGTPAMSDVAARMGLSEYVQKVRFSKRQYEKTKAQYDKIMKKALKMIGSKKLQKLNPLKSMQATSHK